MLPRKDIVWSYVIENTDENGKIVVTDFFSMNRLQQTCTDKNKQEGGHNHQSMYSGTGYYYGLTKNTLPDVQKQMFWIAKEEMDCDAFCLQTLLDNTVEYC